MAVVCANNLPTALGSSCTTWPPSGTGLYIYKCAVTTVVMQAMAADLEQLELERNGNRAPQEHASNDTVGMSTEVPVSDRVREVDIAEYEASLERGRIRTGPLGPEADLSQQRRAAVRTANALACAQMQIKCCIEQTKCPMECCIHRMHSNVVSTHGSSVSRGTSMSTGLSPGLSLAAPKR